MAVKLSLFSISALRQGLGYTLELIPSLLLSTYKRGTEYPVNPNFTFEKYGCKSSTKKGLAINTWTV